MHFHAIGVFLMMENIQSMLKAAVFTSITSLHAWSLGFYNDLSLVVFLESLTRPYSPGVCLLGNRSHSFLAVVTV